MLNLGECVSDASPCRPKNKKYSCFDKVSAPMGSKNNPLLPFTSMAANDIKYGTTGIIKEFVGKKTPKGQTHP